MGSRYIKCMSAGCNRDASVGHKGNGFQCSKCLSEVVVDHSAKGNCDCYPQCQKALNGE